MRASMSCQQRGSDLLKGSGIGAVRSHVGMECGAARNKAAINLGLVLTPDQTHELGHAVLVVPGGAERVVLGFPGRRVRVRKRKRRKAEAADQRGGKMTKSQTATPGTAVGAVRTQ